MPKQGDLIPNHSAKWKVWHRQWENTDPVGTALEGPNYPRQIGALVAGMLQQQPVTISSDDPPLDDSQLADLTDRGVKRAAAESVVFLRPAQVGGNWVVTVMNATNVDATWEHDTLVEAIVWRIIDDDTKMILEHYRPFDPDHVDEVQLWTVKRAQNQSQWELCDRIDISEERENEPALYRQLRQMEPRRLVPFAWDFEDGVPVPIHYTNEALVDHLANLHVMEGDDDSIPRNIIAVSEESMRSSERAYDGSKKLGRLRGMRPGKNLLSVPGDQMAQNGTEAFVKQIRMQDDLVTRDKIARREDQLFEACGIAPQSFGRHVGGRSDSAAAKRADNQTTLVTIAGPARRWAQALSDIANEIARLQSGATEPGDAFAVQVREGLKSSQEEHSELIATQRSADVISVEQGVRAINPEWTDAEIAAEVRRIKVDNDIGTAPDLAIDDEPI